VLRVVSPPNLLSTICLLTRIYRQHAPILRGLPYVRSNSLLHLPDARIPSVRPSPCGAMQEPECSHYPSSFPAPLAAVPSRFTIDVVSWLHVANTLITACSTCSGGPAKRRCSRCKAAFYCDRGCQKADWKTHRNVCEPAQQTYSAPATPSFSSPASPTNEG
jgi:hypothetical protein